MPAARIARATLALALLALHATISAASAAPAAQGRPALAPPDATLQEDVEAAIARMAAEVVRLDPAGKAPAWAPPATTDATPLAALDEAARQLALVRVCVGLRIDEAGRPGLGPEAIRDWLRSFAAGLGANATALVERSAGAAVPPPGPRLEDATLPWLPPYEVAARGRDLSALANAAVDAEHVDGVVREAARLETYRVLWEHRPPRLPDPPAAGNASLSVRDVDAIRARALHAKPGALTGITLESAFTREADFMAMDERARGRAFGALLFNLVAEQAAVAAHHVADAAARRLDLRPQVEAELAGLTEPPSLLLRHAQEGAVAALDAAPTPQAALANASRLAAALGDYAKVRTLRGEARPPDVAVVVTEGPARAPGLDVLALVAAVAGIAAFRRNPGSRKPGLP